MVPDESLALVLLVALSAPPHVAPQLRPELLGHHVAQKTVPEVPFQFGVRL